MDSALRFYVAFVGLFVILAIVVSSNFVALGFNRHPTAPVWYIASADPQRGRALIHERGCGGCHVVPGVPGAVGQVGPPLDNSREKIYVAGVLPNTPPNLIYWIANPKQADPRTAMPDLNISEADARDIAAYLYELR